MEDPEPGRLGPGPVAHRVVAHVQRLRRRDPKRRHRPLENSRVRFVRPHLARNRDVIEVRRQTDVFEIRIQATIKIRNHAEPQAARAQFFQHIRYLRKGAAWTFVVWGLIHGVLLVIERVCRAIFKDAAWTESLGVQVLIALVTYIAICFTWVFFRAGDFTTAARLVRAMVGFFPNGEAILTTREILQVAIVSAGLLLAHWLMRNTTIEAVVSRTPRWLITTVWAVMLFAIILNQGSGSAFIYFQF